MVIKDIISGGNSSWPFGHIVDDIHREVNSIRFCNWSFTRRMGNAVAHYLAKHAQFVIDCESWMEVAPEFLFTPLYFDCS